MPEHPTRKVPPQKYGQSVLSALSKVGCIDAVFIDEILPVPVPGIKTVNNKSLRAGWKKGQVLVTQGSR